ncbi:HPP family protein [Pseudomonas sp. 21LCFQ02]|uniref:HPP family protein n=1 Tax=unclassified Pseudomonas TaxID=196821 RepID=UPI0004F5C34C|nr:MULTISPECIES: HPP family protein [unclassified Pseudomonas]MCO8161207.1 HPP family protein [Pseudomonas sp. 21LCFQ010]MCO8169186.1 HPP family protein [Pseudomonas sp. 21LCFQ02]MCQ9422181.1 HPP family protein [Pseudomonas sp. LJDD11]BAP45898.1 membrane protein [Pseudomonas sp. StFLB209]
MSETTPSEPRLRARLSAFLRAFWPAPHAIDALERLRASTGAALGILLAAVCAAFWLNGNAAHEHGLLALALVAPLGASAVLVFAVPASPLAQPWSVVGGNTLSALVGIACCKWIPDASLAAALAVGLAIAVMLLMRCLHPPGGASALLMVLMGCDRFEFAFSPVLIDSLLMVLAGLVYNNLTGRSWPHLPLPAKAAPTHLHRADLDAVLDRYNQILDVSRDDLEVLLEQVEALNFQRSVGDLRCRDVMTQNPLSVGQETSLREAWALMRERRIKALPVIDRQQHLLGIVTVADFMGQIDLDVHDGIAWRLRTLVRPKKHDEVRTVGQIMTRTVRVSSSDRLLLDLVPVFSDNGHRHIPIIDDKQRLVGIITQSDLIRALYRAVRS